METTKITMKGMDVQYINLIHESVKICDAIKEFIDNSIDAKATRVNVSLEDGVLIIQDNSPKGMVDKLESFAENYKAHLATTERSIGFKGVGAKDAMLRIADFFGKGSTITILTSDGTRNRKLTWNLCEKTHSINSIYIEDLEEYESLEQGTKIVISNPCDVTSKVMGSIRVNTAYTYSYKMKFEGISIYFKCGDNDSFSKIEPMDFFYLDKLCGNKGEFIHRLYTPNNYECDGIFFMVRMNTFKKNNSNDYIKIPTISIFIADETKRETYDDGRDAFNDAKFGAIFNGRFISNAQTSVKMHFKKAQNTGGSWRCRTLILIDETTYDLLSGKSNKSKGINCLSTNSLLQEYSVVISNDICEDVRKIYKTEDKKNGKQRNMNAYETLEMQYQWSATLNSKRKAGEKITIDVVNKVTSKKTAISKVSIQTKNQSQSFIENPYYSKLNDNERKFACVVNQVLTENNTTKSMDVNEIINLILNCYCVA